MENPFKQLFEKQRLKSLELRKKPYSNRIQQLTLLEKWIFSNRRAIQEAIFKDFGKSAEEVDITEIYPVLSELRKIKRNLKYWVRPQQVANPMTYWGTQSQIYYEPKGTSLIIAPWNYPFQLSIGPVLSSIAAGNTIFLKPSEFTLHTSALLSRMAAEVFQPEYFTVVEGDYKISGQLLELPFDHIFFTGSPKVGKIVMEAASKNLTSVTLELGGKSPAIVDETASISDTAEKLAWGKWLNAGQTCVAPDYVYCHASVYDKLLQQLEVQVEKIYGNRSKYTAIVSDRHLSRLTAALQADIDLGAKVIFGNTVADGKLSPTVITQLPESSLFLEEEIFGPILPVLKYEDLGNVIAAINNQPKPLAFYHFSGSKRKMKQTEQAVSSGTMCFNDCVIQFVHPELPIGGVNNSGIGKAHGYHGFIAFSNEKAIVRQRKGFTMAKTLYPPFDFIKKITLELLLKYF